MALRQRVNGEYRDFKELSQREDNAFKPIGVLYQYLNGTMRVIWSAVQYIAAWRHREAWRHGEPW